MGTPSATVTITQPPWRVHDNGGEYEILSGKEPHAVQVAEVSKEGGAEEARLDAHMMAASPQMYMALERCVAALAANGAPNCEAVKEAKAAIADAKGGAA